MHFLREEEGLGLVETLLGIVLTVTLVGALVAMVYTAGKGVDTNNSKITAFREIENAAGFMGGDVAMAKYTDLVDGAGAVSTVTLEWTDYYNSTSVGHKSVYALSSGKLQRTYDGVVSNPAKNVTAVGFSKSGSLITVTLTVSATEGSTQFSTSKTYKFYMRPQ